MPDWTIWTRPVPGGETHDQVTARLDRVIGRVRAADAARVLLFGHGHSLRALTLRWLAFDIVYGVHFPLDTGTISELGTSKGRPALVRWNSAPTAVDLD